MSKKGKQKLHQIIGVCDSNRLYEVIETDIPSSLHEQKIKVRKIFTDRETNDVMCTIGSKAVFSTEEKWKEWKFD
jgi:hypothetical protein